MKVFLSMLCLLCAVRGYTFANMTKLRKDLITNYEKEFRPGDNQIIPTELNFSFYMRSLKEFKETYGEMGLVGSLGVEWKDVRLAWNPQDYGGNLNQTSVFVQDIWTPYLVLMNPYEESKPILSSGFSCEVWFNGDVSCLPPPNLFEALCTADIRLYPFDSKTCRLQLYVSGYHSSDLDVQPQSQTFNMEMYAGNGPWHINYTKIFTHTININNKSVKILTLEIKVERSSDRHFWDIIPIIILSALQIWVFVVPNESGERIGFSVTVFLAEVLFLTVIQEKIPEASNSDISYFVYKQFVDLMTSFLTMGAVVITSVYHNKAKTAKLEETKETPSKMNSVRVRNEADKANIEEPEKSKEIPRKINSVGIRKETDKANIEESEEKAEIPSEMISVGTRKHRKSHKFWSDAENRINVYLGVPCFFIVALNNLIFFWIISGI